MKESAHILIVDDLLSMRVVAKKALKELGFSNFDEAADGEKAWKLIRQKALGGSPYDLVVSDWNMPKLDGFHLLQNIKSDDWCKKTPLIFISTDIGEDMRKEAVLLGAVDYIVRPFKPDQLSDAIGKITK